jgi:hypothetical protein
VKFRVTVIADQQPLGGVAIAYRVGPEMMPVEEKTAVVPADGLTIDGGTLREPGFIRCIVTTEREGRTYRGLATAGFRSGKNFADADGAGRLRSLLERGKAELARIPLDTQMTLQPELCSSTIDVYHVSFQNVGTGSATFPPRAPGSMGCCASRKAAGRFQPCFACRAPPCDPTRACATSRRRE